MTGRRARLPRYALNYLQQAGPRASKDSPFGRAHGYIPTDTIIFRAPLLALLLLARRPSVTASSAPAEYTGAALKVRLLLRLRLVSSLSLAPSLLSYFYFNLGVPETLSALFAFNSSTPLSFFSDNFRGPFILFTLRFNARSGSGIDRR